MPSMYQLQYFLVLAEEQHLRRSAEKLFISPSSLSITISRLEEELGVKLFDRSKNQIQLNAYGKAFYNTVSEVFSLLDRGINELHEMHEKEHRTLSVAVPNVEVWRKVLWQFVSGHPQDQISIHPDNVSVYVKELLNGTVDFVISGSTDITHPKICSEVITSVPLCVCLPANHPYAGRKELVLNDLNNMTYISLSPNLPFSIFCEKLLKDHSIRLNKVIECDYQMRPELVRSGAGLAISTYEKTSLEKYSGTAIIPLVGEGTRRELSLFWQKGKVFSTLDSEFYEWVRVQIPQF